MSNIGTLYGLGVGPGDPELITVKAFRNHSRVAGYCLSEEKKRKQKLCPSNCRSVYSP